MQDLYKISLKDHRTRSKKLLRENERCYDSLKIKDGAYAKQVFALQQLHRQVSEVYDNAPNDFDEDAKPF
jgi:hypothetical protein